MKKGTIVALAVLTVLNIIVWFIFVPYQERRLNDEYNSYKALREKLRKDPLLSFEDVYQTREKLGEFEKRLRYKKDFPKLMIYLYEQSFATRVELRNIGYNYEEKKDLKLIKVTMNLTVDGKYDGIRRFIHRIESGSHFFEIGTLKLNRSGEGVGCTMTVVSYLKV